MRVNIIGAHFNPQQWKEPHRFLPERFNPDSEYFLTPAGKKRHPFAFCPFSFGPRACVGQNMAMMELKVFVAFMLLRVNYEIPQAQLDRPDHAILMASADTLTLKILE